MRRGRTLRRLALCGLVTLSAQGPAPVAAQPGAQDAPAHKPGLFPLGPFWLTPRFHLGTLGLDTNVFYTADRRRADFVTSAGPGLELALPTRPLRLDLGAGLDYLYFARTADQRRLNGDAHARVTLASGRLKATLEEAYLNSFDRPSFELDRRVDRSQWSTRGDVALELPGRLQVRTALAAEHVTLPSGQTFQGAELGRTLARDTRRGLAGLGYRLTSKSTLLVEGDLQVDRFPEAALRDTRSNRLLAGFALDSQTRLAGRVLLGARFLRPERDRRAEHVRLFAADGTLEWRFSPRTRLGLRLRRDAGFTAFEVEAALPLLIQTEAELRLERQLTPRLELQLFGRRLGFHTTAQVTLVPDDGAASVGLRDDRVHEAGLQLVERLGRRLKAGFTAGYTRRRSSFADLGIAGLLLGGTLSFVP